MRITNTTNIPTVVLRQLVMWVRGKLKVGSGPKTQQIDFRRSHCAHGSALPDILIGLTTSGVTRNSFTTCHIPVSLLGGDQAVLFYHLVLYFGAFFRAHLLSEGEMGLFRQKIGADFLQDKDRLIRDWYEKVPVPNPLARHEQKVKTAEMTVRKWERKVKLAQTKFKIWKRRLRAAELALKKRREQCQTK